MKFAVALLATLAVCTAHLIPRDQSALSGELKDFLKLVDLTAIKELALEYFSNDEEVQEVFFYLGSDEFRDLALTFQGMREVKDLYAFLDQAGLDVYRIIDKVHEILNLPPFEHFATRRITGGLAGLVADVKALLPLEELEKLYKYKMANSPVFQDFVKQLKAQNIQAVVDNIFKHPEAKNVIKMLKSKGVDLKKIADLIGSILGINIPTDVHQVKMYESRSELEEIFMEFVQLVPIGDVVETFQQFYDNDENFRGTVEYVQSEQFKQTYLKVEATDEFKQFTVFLNKIGLPIFKYLEELHKLAEMPPYVRPTLFDVLYASTPSGFNGFLTKISEALPVEEIKNLYSNKVETNKRFRAFVEAVSSDESQQYVLALVGNSVVGDAMAELDEHGVDVIATVELIVKIFGIEI